MLVLDALARTALIPFWARVFDSRLEDSILNDRGAAGIADPIEQRFGIAEVDASTRSGCCLRNLFVDQWLTKLTGLAPATVVDIGVGLDTRLLRLPLRASRYIEVDSDDVIQLRDTLVPRSTAVRIAGDGMNASTWLPALHRHTDTVILVLEGVLTYQTPQRVALFFAELAEAIPGAFVIFDSLSPWSARMANKPAARSHGRPEYRWSTRSTRNIRIGAERLTIVAEQGLMDFPRKYTQAFGPVQRVAYRLPLLRHGYRLTVARLPRFDDQ